MYDASVWGKNKQLNTKTC